LLTLEKGCCASGLHMHACIVHACIGTGRCPEYFSGLHMEAYSRQAE